MTHRFADRIIRQTGEPLIDSSGNFTGCIATHTERLDIPLNRRKSTVYAVWNDLFHEDVPDGFIRKAYQTMFDCPRHTFLILTKRAGRMADYFKKTSMMAVNVWHGLTICNQQEADEKIPVFLKVPGKKFLSIEPMLGEISLRWLRAFNGSAFKPRPSTTDHLDGLRLLDAVLLGGETGPGARPMHPYWVRSIRDQCASAGVPFFFKQWGEWTDLDHVDFGWWNNRTKTQRKNLDQVFIDGEALNRVGRKAAGRLLSGRTHDELPWVKG
jgi:protein gp37